jgi:hypothetical protein
MSHVLTVSRKRNYLHVIVTGDNTATDIQQYLTEVRDACEQQSCPYVLIEENLAGPSLGTLDLFHVIANAAPPSPAVRCIAYIDVNPEHDAERMKFAETVASNRGMLVKVFSSMPDAEAWIAQFAAASGKKAC